MHRVLFIFMVLLLWAVSPTSAQDSGIFPAPGNETADPGAENDPTRGVARISLLNGDVSVRRGDSGDVVAAALNAPLVSQDRLLTSSSSRAEVQFDYGNMLRIGSNSEVRMNDIEQRRFQVQIACGTVTFRVLRNLQSEIELDTPSIAFRPLRPGSYRVTVRDDGSTELSVRDGEAEIFGPRGTERLHAGTSILARGPADDPEFREVASLGLDDWDRWNQSRDHQLESSRSYQYVSPDITGAEDLEGYGRWANDPQYGNVWVPQVEPGWAPYRSGRWVWEDFYGWTWISYDPWGWAPYHYGRWYSGPFGWAWYPGSRYSRHYWSPALVAFFGFGGRSGVGFGFGNLGWVPLAPHERFHPWWGRSVYSGFVGDRRFGNRTTIVTNTNITNLYRNARVNNGLTVVGANDFGRHTGRYIGMSGNAVREAAVIHGVLPLTPDRASLRLADRPVRASAFTQDRNINFAGRRSIPQSTRVPFDQQQRSIDQVARQTFGGSRVDTGRGFDGNRNGANPSAGTGQGQINQSWRRSGEPPAQPQASPQPSQNSFPERGGTSGPLSHEWSRFGEPIHGSVPDSGSRMRPAQPYSGETRSYTGQSGAQNNEAGTWHRFGQPSGASSSAQTTPQSSGRSPYYEGGSSAGSRRYQSAPQSYPTYLQPAQQYNPARDYGREASSQAVRISPPIVRERSTPMPMRDNSRANSSPAYRSFGGNSGARSNPPSDHGNRQNSSSGNHNSGGSNSSGGRNGGRR